jgi:hypothetical protein
VEPTTPQEVKGGNGLSHGENWKLDEIGLEIVENHPIKKYSYGPKYQLPSGYLT